MLRSRPSRSLHGHMWWNDRRNQFVLLSAFMLFLYVYFLWYSSMGPTQDPMIISPDEIKLRVVTPTPRTWTFLPGKKYVWLGNYTINSNKSTK